MEKHNTLFDRRIHPRIETMLPIELKGENSSTDIASNISCEAINLSENGLCLATENRLPKHSSVILYINAPPYLPIEVEAQVVWTDPVLKKNRLHYGLRFSELNIDILRKLLEEINRQHIATFFGVSLPSCLTINYRDNYILEKLDQQQIMKIIDYRPPYLKIEKAAVLGFKRGDLLQMRGLGMGTITTKDTEGHYNDTIFLAMCGNLMASAASVFLAILFPSTAPQVVEANGVKPLPLLGEAKGLWKPTPSGTTFFVESTIMKKRLQLVIIKTTISFDNILYGVIEELKLILTPKDSIWSAKSFPTSGLTKSEN